MDYARMLEFHIEKRADVTISVVERPQRESVHYGVVQVEKDSRIEGFEEKPKKPTTIPGKANRIYASMGIYIFNTQVLFEELRQDAKTASDHDFGKNIIPQMMGRRDLCAYRFSDRNHGGDAYWKDIGTLDAYYLANMDLVSTRPSFDLYDTDWPIRTYEPQVPPAKIVSAADGENAINGETVDSIVSHGCIISGGCVVRSVLSPGVRVNCDSSVQDSVLMEGVNVGRHAKVRNAIIDKHVTIPPAARIGYDLTEDRKRYIVARSGIVVVEKGMTIEPYQATHQRRKIPLDGDPSTVYQLDVQRLPLQVSI
jgi:glucose-1-phosphate adenylyltransferase